MKIVCYVLCANNDLLEESIERWRDHECMRPILLPQTPYLENVMYISELMARRDEWEDADWVGCVSSKVESKQPMIRRIRDICTEATKNDSDFIALLYRGDPLISAAERWHPGFTRCWLAVWQAIGWNSTDMLLRDDIPSFYANYWLSKPAFMDEYCAQMRYTVQRVQTIPVLRELCYRDSSYSHRGVEIASITPEKCMELFGVGYYPVLIFVLERMICCFALARAKKLTLVR
jgi:hypothetical protein